MTEEEWLACDDVGEMLAYTTPSPRKMRLFFAAHVRMNLLPFDQPEFRHTVDSSEMFAKYPSLRCDPREDLGPAVQAAPLADVASSIELHTKKMTLFIRRCAEDAPLVREIIGHPSWSIAFDASLRTPTVVSIAFDAFDASLRTPTVHCL